MILLPSGLLCRFYYFLGAAIEVVPLSLTTLYKPYKKKLVVQNLYIFGCLTRHIVCVSYPSPHAITAIHVIYYKMLSHYLRPSS